MKFNQLPASADVSTWTDYLRLGDLIAADEAQFLYVAACLQHRRHEAVYWLDGALHRRFRWLRPKGDRDEV